MKKIERKLIEEIAEKIRTKLEVEKIILFGSAAWGKMSECRDIDLFIIMKSDLRRDKRAILISGFFADREFPLDIIVYTPKEVESGLKRKNPFLQKVINEGKVLYAA